MSTAIPIDVSGYLTRPGRHVWVGRFAPLDWPSVELGHGTNYRSSAAHHQRYDTVWLYEYGLGAHDITRLELILDESIRLLGEQGVLVLRYMREVVPAVKKLLARRPNLTAEVEREWMAPSEIISVVRVRREQLSHYRDRRWTFAILTTGGKEEAVVRFLRSVRDPAEGKGHEVLVCGPRSPAYDPYHVTYLDRTYRTDVAEIARKKNDIAAAAKHPNLLIAHDRYVLNPDFYAGFDRFGYDFDVATVRQWLDTGEEFPAYCALQKGDLTAIGPRMLRQYSGLYPGTFLNGGLFAVKTHVCRSLGLNPILYWDQAEDVEFSQVLRDHGLPPRINCFASAETRLVGPRGQASRIDYRIGKPPLPDHVTVFPPDDPPRAPPDAAAPLPPAPPAESRLVRTYRGAAHLVERLIGLVVGRERAARLVRGLLARKLLVAGIGLVLLLQLACLVVLLVIALRPPR